MGAADWVAAGAHAASAETDAAMSSVRRVRVIGVTGCEGSAAARVAARGGTEMVSPTAAMRQGPAPRRGPRRFGNGGPRRFRRGACIAGGMDLKPRTTPRRAPMTGRASFVLFAL